MERIKTILKSGVRKINLVAPHSRLTAALRQEIAASPFKGLCLDETRMMKTSDDWCNIVAFSRRDEELVASYAILNSIVYTCQIPGSRAQDIYSELKANPLEPIYCKAIMRRHGIGTFYSARKIVAAFAQCGLFFPIESSDGRLRMLPYYCESREEHIQIARHLLSLGYAPILEGSLMRARLGRGTLVVGHDIDSINSAAPAGVKILISPDSPVLNFSAIRSFTLEDFLETKRLS